MSLTLSSRFPIERMQRIHEELRRGAFVNCSTLAKALEVSGRTVWRDITFMRDRLNLPIEFDSRINAYRYTHPVAAFPTMHVTEGELVALLIARKALEQYRGMPFHRQLEASFEKISAGLRDKISFSPGDELRAVSFKNIGLGQADIDLFNTLSEAAVREREVRFDYHKPGETRKTRRHVRPYHLALRENLWYLVGFDLGRGAERTFALSRISAPEVLAITFQRPPDFSPEKFFASALGVHGGAGDFRIVIRFSPVVADHIRGREWHESQQLRELANGGVELKLRLGALDEVERWLLTWRADAEVLQPKELRDRVKTTLAAMAKLYR